MRREAFYLVLGAAILLAGCASSMQERKGCAEVVNSGFRPIAQERTERFLGKVQEATALCRGGDKAVEFRDTPYVDWENYWATGDGSSMFPGTSTIGSHFYPNGRGIDGALLDLEYQRIELIKFNLFDNSGTYHEYVEGRGGVAGPALKVWKEMRLPKDNPNYEAVGGDGPLEVLDHPFRGGRRRAGCRTSAMPIPLATALTLSATCLANLALASS